MRALPARLARALGLLAWVAIIGQAPAAQAASSPQRTLSRVLNAGMRAAGNYSGAYVQDLATGQTLYSHNARTGRLPASVEKLYTTSAALLKFGASGTLTTSVLAAGTPSGDTFTGTLYLKGGGDPTFGSDSFDRASYGTGATMESLATGLAANLQSSGVRRLDGNIVADESALDSRRGTPATGYHASIDVEGELSGLSYNRGWASRDGTVYWYHPALQAGRQFLAALKAAGIQVPKGTTVSAGPTPSDTRALAGVASPPIATLVSLTNTPSDNFFAEMLLKDLGAHYGAGGTTPDGAAVVRSAIAQQFGLHPRLNDGSGLSRYDRTTPFDVVSLLRQQAADQPFTSSLAIAGRTGTLIDEMRGTYAQGRCRGKTGTLRDASNVVGYCRARDGHTLAYAVMMNGIYPDYAHPIQNRMLVALARYNG
jgi:D-alanyl-D-alanine carboxypeptidase/D-alanyl-D-alanine-endopeptidase (penicillin-binding protein 4)